VTARIVDPGRTIGTARRSFDAIIRYPVSTRAGESSGPFPLIVFGHGFAVTPQPYSQLLDAWTRAGYVVAAPIFPLENANAPGGPHEKDLVNQPADMSLMISWMAEASQSAARPLAGIVDTSRVAVSGQSDGGDTALAAAYDPTVRDPRVRAAMVLPGAEDPFAAPFVMPRTGPELLAVQGTADTINPPDSTYQFYLEAAPPKYLLQLIGAGHQPPYTQPGPQLAAITRTTIAFLDAVFKKRRSVWQRLRTGGGAGSGAVLIGADR
jgi:dienelactone hydrolase